MAKKYIKGFSGLRFWPVTANTAEAYTTGTVFAVAGAQSATTDRSTEDYTVYADDQVWDSGADFQSEKLEITVLQLPLDLMAKLDGADHSEQTKTYSWGPDKVAPELAVGFRALKADGTYRMIKYYSGKVNTIKTDYTTKGSNKEGSAYVITLTMNTRVGDGKLHIIKDTESASDLTWLDTVDQLPTE